MKFVVDPVLGANTPAAEILSSQRRNKNLRASEYQPYGMTSKKNSGKLEADRIEEENRVLEMKRQNMTDRDIAAALGVSHTTVQNRLKAALTRYASPIADEFRKEVHIRLEGMYDALLPKIHDGDTKAIAAALGIIDRLAKLHGLDAPSKIEMTVETEADREIKNLLGQIATRSHEAKQALEPIE